MNESDLTTLLLPSANGSEEQAVVNQPNVMDFSSITSYHLVAVTVDSTRRSNKRITESA